MMMNRRLFLRLLLALSAAVGMSGSVLLLLERLGLLDSAQRPQIEAQRAEFEKAARKANTIEGAIVSRDGIPFTSASEPGKPALVTALCYSSLVATGLPLPLPVCAVNLVIHSITHGKRGAAPQTVWS